MTSFRRTATSAVALGLCLNGSAAFADLSAQDVWGDWKAYMQGFGYTVEGAESTSGDTLTVSDVSIAMDLPDGAGAMRMSVSEFSFSDNGDGTVNVGLPASMPVTLSIDSPDAEDVDMALDYVTEGFNMVVSGDPENLTYDYTADMLSMVLNELVVDDQPIEIGEANISMADISGSSTMVVGNLRKVSQTMTSDAVTYVLNFVDPEGGGKADINGRFAGLGFEATGDYPAEVDTTDMSAMLAAGFGFEGNITHEGGSFNLDYEEEGDAGQVQSTSENGSLAVAMTDGKLKYDIASNNAKMMIMGAEIPFPVELAMAQSAFKFLMPISKSDDEQDFALAISLSDFTMSDMIWGMFDPTSQLPRDPATVAVDLSGKAKLFVDIMNPEQMESVENGEELPGELNALTLNALTVRLAGAELTGDGAFTFDNSDLETFDGVPAPDGAVDLQLSGANSLIDKLVGMGLLPEDQAMGARMMMGLFAVPGEGEDVLTSKIEVKPNGQILANGQRLQ